MEIIQADKVLAGLAVQQAAGIFCDIELKAEEQIIPAHKSVLSASSAYFEAMFMGNFEETNAQVIEVRGVSFSGLKNVVGYIYTGNVEIKAENIEDILSAAHLLQMTDIEEQCKDWMSERITEINCFGFLRLAERYSIGTLEIAITNFILKNIKTVSEAKGFEEISKEALCCYLSSDYLKTGRNELTVYQAAKTWINRNKITNSDTLLDIMRNVRFGLIPLYTLSTEVASDDIIDDYKECHGLVSEATKYHADVYNQPFYEGNMNKARGKSGILIITNNPRFGNAIANFILLPGLNKAAWSKFLDTSIVHGSMSAIAVNGFLFLFASSCDTYKNFTKRYDVANDTWMDLAAVPWPRDAIIGSAIACSEDKKEIFQIGGMPVKTTTKLINADNVLTCMNGYNIPKNKWFSM